MGSEVVFVLSSVAAWVSLFGYFMLLAKYKSTIEQINKLEKIIMEIETVISMPIPLGGTAGYGHMQRVGDTLHNIHYIPARKMFWLLMDYFGIRLVAEPKIQGDHITVDIKIVPKNPSVTGGASGGADETTPR